VLAVFVYAPSLGNGLLWDDHALIEKNAFICIVITTLWEYEHGINRHHRYVLGSLLNELRAGNSFREAPPRAR